MKIDNGYVESISFLLISSELLSKMSEQEKQLTEVTSRANQLETQLEETSDQMRLYKDASQNLQMVLENFQKGGLDT